MKKLSVKGLADYMTASAVKQRSILRQHKYEEDDEGRARILYYRDARDRIAAFHRGGHPTTWLVDQAAGLSALAALSEGRTRSRLQHNARGLRAYATGFGSRSFEVMRDDTYRLNYGDVVITVRPDLHVRERGAEKLVKLDFSREPPPDPLIGIICQLMFEAASVAGLGLRSSGILLLDVARAVEHRGARAGSRMRREVEAACANISAIWDSV